jgi:hypothetical protein
MKRFRLSTLMLLIVIAALGTALVVQHRQAARREAELRAKIDELEQAGMADEWRKMSDRRIRRYGLAVDRLIKKSQPPRATEAEEGKR